MDTTRTFPRTSAQAFPRSVVAAACIEMPDPRARRRRRLRDFTFGLAMAGVVALVLYGVAVGWIFGGAPA